MPDLFGSYIIHEELGAGGMATVHLAETTKTEGGFRRKVALKRLFPQVAKIPELVASFTDEAKLARFLRHPNIAQVYDYGKVDHVYYISFEFVPGPTVEQLVKQCAAHVGPIPVRVVLEIIMQLCDALDHAHSMRDEQGKPLGIVHRDVSPQNLIVSNSGLVKLIDFGLAKAKNQSTESQAGIIKGKLSYVAPEYLRGQLDARCDLWAAGVVLHELLTGRRLFMTDDNFQTLTRIRQMPIPPPSQANAEVSKELDLVVMTALERDPTRRWQTAADFKAALMARGAQGRELSKAQLVAWVEWAFTQKAKEREDSSMTALDEILESGLITEIDEASAPTKLPATFGAMEERRRESIAMKPLVYEELLPLLGDRGTRGGPVGRTTGDAMVGERAIPEPPEAPQPPPVPAPRYSEPPLRKKKQGRWLGRLFLLIVLASIAATGYGAYANLFSDDAAVRAQAEGVARGAAGCGAACKLSRVEGSRGILSETLTFTLDGKLETVTCKRAYVAIGAYACSVAP